MTNSGVLSCQSDYSLIIDTVCRPFTLKVHRPAPCWTGRSTARLTAWSGTSTRPLLLHFNSLHEKLFGGDTDMLSPFCRFNDDQSFLTKNSVGVGRLQRRRKESGLKLEAINGIKRWSCSCQENFLFTFCEIDMIGWLKMWHLLCN